MPSSSPPPTTATAILEALAGAHPLDAAPVLPPPPPWRVFGERTMPDERFVHRAPDLPDHQARLGADYQHEPIEVEVVAAALLLRRPILLTGQPGTGKTSLAYWAAYRLGLGEVLHWSITSRSTLKSGIYDYDAIGRLQAAQAPERLNRKLEPAEIAAEIGRYVSLGPLGTALLPSPHPRVLVIDEVDKGDIDLPGDLLDVLERGFYPIAELKRLPPEAAYDCIRVRPQDTRPSAVAGADQSREGGSVTLHRGQIQCYEFPLIFLTSNGEREFSPAFLRRCLRLEMAPPDHEKLRRIVEKRLPDQAARPDQADGLKTLVAQYLEPEGPGAGRKVLSPDQLLNVFFLQSEHGLTFDELRRLLLKPLNEPDVAREAPRDAPPGRSTA